MMHKAIGILGGMSPESTVAYYEYLTRTYVRRFGDHSYPEILIYSVSFQDYVDWPEQERWDLVAEGLSHSARVLEAAGADFILIATNTMHIVFDEVESSVDVPMLSLLDAVADAIEERRMETVGLLGTAFTMEKDFYRDALAERGISVVVPSPEDRKRVNDIIYCELVAGEIRDASGETFVRIVDDLAHRSAEGVILGCTEIPLLIGDEDTSLPLFDTTKIHADAALCYAVEE
ncbi:MAG: aspartate/glutamate racemase family protein [Anaerolineae bacterium]|jgi:aspartate racemase